MNRLALALTFFITSAALKDLPLFIVGALCLAIRPRRFFVAVKPVKEPRKIPAMYYLPGQNMIVAHPALASKLKSQLMFQGVASDFGVAAHKAGAALHRTAAAFARYNMAVQSYEGECERAAAKIKALVNKTEGLND